MPTLEEIRRQAQEKGAGQRGVNEGIAQAVQTGVLTKGLGVRPQEHEGPELTGPEAAQRVEGYEPELTDEQVRQRLGEAPTEQPPIESIIQRMAQNYQTSPRYQQLLDQELMQISEQIAELTQRRNMIEMAKRSQSNAYIAGI